jgi:hypothetical protein
MSGAGSAAYRFCRLVNVPELRMSHSAARRRRAAVLSVFAAVLLLPAASFSAAGEGVIGVVVDQAKLVKLPERISTLVVGNPLIADVTLQPGGLMIVTGKSYGATNLIAMDREGNVLTERMIEVEGPTDKLVTVYRGTARETYSCTPSCQRRVTLGDGQGYFTEAIGQAGMFNSTAAGTAMAAGSASMPDTGRAPAGASSSSSGVPTSSSSPAPAPATTALRQ